MGLVGGPRGATLVSLPFFCGAKDDSESGLRTLLLCRVMRFGFELIDVSRQEACTLVVAYLYASLAFSSPLLPLIVLIGPGYRRSRLSRESLCEACGANVLREGVVGQPEAGPDHVSAERGGIVLQAARAAPGPGVDVPVGMM